MSDPTETLVQSLFETSTTCIVLVDANQIIVEANAAFLKKFEFEKNEISDQKATVLFAGNTNGESNILDISQLFKDDEAEPVTLRIDYQKKSGGTFIGVTTIDAVRDQAKDLAGYVLNIRDDTTETLGPAIASQLEFARQNQLLEFEEARFRDLYRRTPAIMHSIDADGLITEVSDEWLNLLDYQRDDVIGHPSSSFLSDESREYAVSTALPELWARGSVSRVAYTILTRNRLPVEVELSAHLRADGTSLAVMEDVTERNAAQRALQRKNNALQTANEEFRQFAFVASHDLQEPLRKIRAFCDVLEEAIEENNAEDIEYSMSVVRNSAERSSQLISDLLALSRAGNRELSKTRFDLREALQETLECLAPLFTEKNATASLDFANEQITGDRASFLQMMHHFLGNAAQYSRSDTKPLIRLWTDKSSLEHTLNIEDNGIGISPQYHESIFEPFKRLHARTDYDGTGIGLAICKKIADRHGWNISVSGNENHGTIFTLHMPA